MPSQADLALQAAYPQGAVAPSAGVPPQVGGQGGPYINVSSFSYAPNNSPIPPNERPQKWPDPPPQQAATAPAAPPAAAPQQTQADAALAALTQEAASAPTPGTPPTLGDSVMKGLNDVSTAGGQMLVHALPQGAVDAVNNATGYVNSLPGIGTLTQMLGMVPATAAQVDQNAKQGELQYQADRQAGANNMSGLVTGQQPNPGIDWGRIGGNVLGTLPLTAAEAPAALSKVPALAKVLLQGGAINALSQPVTSGDYATEKGTQAVVGALSGGAGNAVMKGAAAVISPAILPMVKALMKEGVTPTMGQTLGGAWNRIEQAATSIPVVGDMIKNAQIRANTQFNAAAVNRALTPIGDKLPAGTSGRDAIAYAVNSLGDRYDSVLPKTSTQMDSQFLTEVQNLRNMISNGSIDPTKATQFENLLQNQVLTKFQPGRDSAPTITGQTMKQIDSDLRTLAEKFKRSNDPDQSMVGDALEEVRTSLRGNVARSNPAQAAEIKSIDTGYANLMRTQRAAGYLAADEGNFTPAQLQNAVKALDPSKNDRQFATGKALMQDLSEAGKSVLGSKVPDSGTPYRHGVQALGAALLGHSMLPESMAHMAIPAVGGLGIAALPYTQTGQKLAAALLTKRPVGADRLAALLQNAAPYSALAAPAIAAGSK